MDNNAVKILLKTFDTALKNDPVNWTKSYSEYINEDDFDYAKKKEIMFEPRIISHDEIFVRTKEVVSQIKKNDVVNAFLYSLSTRKIEYRSFISSYCIARVTPIHSIKKKNDSSIHCSICGLHSMYYSNEFNKSIDLNIVNYFKHKFGSCFEFAHEILFDLEQFLLYPKVTPTKKDFDILNHIKEIIESASPKDSVPLLKKSISKAFTKSNNRERETLLEILGIIGILHDEQHFGFAEHYILSSEREGKNAYYDDVLYPANWWKGINGIDQEKWDYWFN